MLAGFLSTITETLTAILVLGVAAAYFFWPYPVRPYQLQKLLSWWTMPGRISLFFDLPASPRITGKPAR
ncbi:MAG: hypothetical protein HYY09_05480 [Firmicutes bacterium]|nr:hypothetical protein [Bacillota bacterium]